jgi:hypothetical protein
MFDNVTTERLLSLIEEMRSEIPEGMLLEEDVARLHYVTNDSGAGDSLHHSKW